MTRVGRTNSGNDATRLSSAVAPKMGLTVRWFAFSHQPSTVPSMVLGVDSVGQPRRNSHLVHRATSRSSSFLRTVLSSAPCVAGNSASEVAFPLLMARQVSVGGILRGLPGPAM